MPRVFVAGATGYTGREVVRELVARGVPTVAHVRPDSPRLEEWQRRFAGTGAETDATSWDEGAIAETLGRVAPTHVFALLGTTRVRGRAAAREGRVESYETVDIGLTALLIRAAGRLEARPRFIYLSAVGVSAAARGAYLRARGRVEQQLMASGLPYTIARPSFITGPDRDDGRPFERVGAGLIDGALVVAGLVGARRLQARYRSTTSTALARALVEAALDPAAENAILESEHLGERARLPGQSPSS